VYVRPHELDIEPTGAGGGLRARVLHVSPVGPVARVALHAEEVGAAVQVEVQRGRLEELGLEAGQTVFVAPRQARVFLTEDYAI
jgi:sulfate transport system ATP-binding protein